MSNKIKFNRRDCPKPTVDVTGLIALRSPITFTVKAGVTYPLNLGISADRALLLVGPNSYVRILGDDSVVAANQNIRFVLKNVSIVDDFVVGLGDTVARAHVLGSEDTEVE